MVRHVAAFLLFFVITASECTVGHQGFGSATYETSISENGVVLEEQMMKLGATAGEYNMATNIYRKYLALHRTALGRGQG